MTEVAFLASRFFFWNKKNIVAFREKLIDETYAMPDVHSKQDRSRGFTLIEILVVLGILAVLGAILIPVSQKALSRAEAARCSQNLRNLHVALSLYLKEEGHWPQIDPQLISQPKQYGQAWMNALEPYGATQEIWICPTVRKALNEQEFANPEDRPTVHYTPTPFDDKPLTPYRWATQPWALEIGDSHGAGALVLFPDGTIEPMSRVTRRVSGSR